MTFTPYVAEIKAVTALMESAEYDSPEALAEAILAKSWEMFTAKRGKFTVVSQLRYTDPRSKEQVEKDQEMHNPRVSPYVKPGDPRLVTVSLGWFPTETAARTAAQSMYTSTATREEWQSMVIPIHHGTPAEWHKSRKVEMS